MSRHEDVNHTPTHSIRPLNPNDADWITEACQDPEVQRWTSVPTPYRRDHAVEFLENRPPNERRWAILDDEGRPVGSIDARGIDTSTPEIGYYVAPWGRRRGAARDAIGLLLDEVAEFDNVTTVRAYIADNNVASQAAVRAAGFELVGDADQDCTDGESKVPALLFERQLVRP